MAIHSQGNVGKYVGDKVEVEVLKCRISEWYILYHENAGQIVRLLVIG